VPKSKADELIDFIVDGFKIIIIAGVCIYASYHIIRTLVGELPAWIGSILIGLLTLYIVVINTRVKDFFKRGK
jgi:hypothetical protein